MRILADENMPLVREMFDSLGTVETLPGREITRERLTSVDMLLVRSVTKVNADLLADTPVRFVGSATSGIDHVDTAYLAERGIEFAYAPGSNANSVAEYVVAALVVLGERDGFDPADLQVGVVGAGHVGNRVIERVEALGARCIAYDPPLARVLPDKSFALIDALYSCDVITLHVPLEHGGSNPTYHLVDESFLARTKPGSILINAARGGVVDECALLRARASGRVRHFVLDVWEGEPAPNPEMIRAAAIATPHIAGYSYDGKLNGTLALYDAARKFQGRTDNSVCPFDRPEGTDRIVCSTLASAVREAYDIMADDARMRPLADLDELACGTAFDRLRKSYPMRREFVHHRIRLRDEDTKLRTTLTRLGFTLLGPHE